MMQLPNALPGLSDGGAHVGIICDASFPSYLLSYWTRDRNEGRFPIEWVVQFRHLDPPSFWDYKIEELLASGMKADINIIDYDALAIDAPRMVCDLPGGASRLMQKSKWFCSHLCIRRADYTELSSVSCSSRRTDSDVKSINRLRNRICACHEAIALGRHIAR